MKDVLRDRGLGTRGAASLPDDDLPEDECHGPLSSQHNQYGSLHRECKSFALYCPDQFLLKYNRRFYMQYFIRWPEYNVIAESLDATPIGYSKFRGNFEIFGAVLWFPSEIQNPT